MSMVDSTQLPLSKAEKIIPAIVVGGIILKGELMT